jgi:chromosomal replication initiator protein
MYLPDLWERTLSHMQGVIGHEQVEIWLRQSVPLAVEDDVLLLEVPNRYYREWIVENYLPQLCGVLGELNGSPLDVRFEYTEDLPTAEAPRSASVEEPIAVGRDQRGSGVNPDQTFASFVVGESNKFAHAAAEGVVNNPARGYNPLFVYGDTGLGKTHLMHAIGNAILDIYPTSRVVYVTAEDFMNEMINCIRYKRMEDFRAKYRKAADVLLVDDVQFLSGKDRTQEEFFHTFNALQSAGRQIVLTSDVPPRDIDKLEPRLRTRFEGGLLADLQAPDRETLLAILAQKADGRGLVIPPDLANAIADLTAGNIRELEGVLNQLAALYSFYSEPLTLDFAQRRMASVFTPAPAEIGVNEIIEAVARFHNLRSADITGHKRTRTLTVPRHIAMYLARRHTRLSFPELGKEFGSRDHSTIQHGFRKVEKELRTDPDLAYKVRLIEQTIRSRAR